MKFLYVLPVFALLVACSETPADCMAPNEKGKVVRSETESSVYCGRGGCIDHVNSYVTVEVNGVSRICVVDDSTAKMFKPGDVINLRTGRRL